MQAIVTKWLKPTDTRGSRIKAKCAAGSLTLGWDCYLTREANHRAAAIALVEKLGWADMTHDGLPVSWVLGCLSDWSYVYVCRTAQEDKAVQPKVKP